MKHQEIDISDKNYKIRANIIIPSNTESKNGIILAHGGIVNRQSLLRKNYSFGEYLSKELDAYIIAPDLLGETIHKKGTSYENFSEILNISTDYLVETYPIEHIMGFGHSLGCFFLADSLSSNKYIESIANYGGPIRELDGARQKGLISYLIKYLSTYDYSINIKHMLRAIFDRETCIYLDEVMLNNEEYHPDNYVFDFNSEIFGILKEQVDTYLNNITNWGKPALLLFGSDDGVTRKTRRYYKNNPLGKNIQFMEIPGASHVTPCMSSINQLSKLEPVIAFFEQTIKKPTHKSIKQMIK